VRALWASLDSDSSRLDDIDSSRILEAIDSLHEKTSSRHNENDAVAPISARLGLSLATAVHRLGMTRAVFLSSRHGLSIPYRRMSFVELVRMASMLSAASVTEVALLDALSVGIGRGALDGLRADLLVVLLQSLVGVNWQGTRAEKGRVTAAAVRSRVHLDAGDAVGLLHVLTRDAGKAGGRRWRGASEMGAGEDILAASDLVGGLMGRMGMKELGLAAKAYGRLLEHSEGDTVPGDDIDEDLVRVRGHARGMLDRIAGQAAACVDGADPKDLVRLIQAFQLAGLKPEGLLDVLDVWADKRLAAMNASGISLAMAHFARVGEASPRLLKTAVEVAEANVERLTASDASRLLWAFAHLQYDPGQVLRRKGVQVLAGTGTGTGVCEDIDVDTSMSDRELANLFWGLVRLEEYPSVEERGNIAAALVRAPGKVSGQSAALLLWSFASSQEAFGHRSGTRADRRTRRKGDAFEFGGFDGFEKSMYRLGLDLCADVRSVDSQSISMTAWSLGVLKIKHPEFAACLDTLGDTLQTFEPQHVSNLVWGLAKSGSRPSQEFMLDVSDALSGQMCLYSPQEVFNVCWGFATMGFASQTVAAETLAELEARGSEFGGLELSGISWALGRMLKRSSDPSIAKQSRRVIQEHLSKRVGELEPSQVAMAVAGLGRLSARHGDGDDDDEALVSDLVDVFCASFRGKAFPSISSVNTLLEGLALRRRTPGSPARGALEAALRDEDVLSRCLMRAQFWEICDLCYYMSQNDMPLAKRVLLDIDAAIAAEPVTPRGAIMLLEAMRRCAVYPPMVLDKATSKISALSPNYRLGDEWLAILRGALREDEQLGRRVRFEHGQWNERML